MKKVTLSEALKNSDKDWKIGDIGNDGKEDFIVVADTKKCPTCHGSGQVVMSCCTGEIVDDDIMMCPKCREHLGEEDCPDCDGTGQVPEDKDDFTDTIAGLQTIAEIKADERKYGDI